MRRLHCSVFCSNQSGHLLYLCVLCDNQELLQISANTSASHLPWAEVEQPFSAVLSAGAAKALLAAKGLPFFDAVPLSAALSSPFTSCTEKEAGCSAFTTSAAVACEFRTPSALVPVL